MRAEKPSSMMANPEVPPTRAIDTQVSGRKKPGLWDRSLWLLMRIAFTDPSLREAQKRAYPGEQLPQHKIKENEARFLFELAETASDHTDDKIKQLLTLSSSLVAVLAVFGDQVRPRVLVVIVASALLVSV